MVPPFYCRRTEARRVFSEGEHYFPTGFKDNHQTLFKGTDGRR